MKKRNLRLRKLFDMYLNDTPTVEERDELWDYVNDPIYKPALEELLVEAYNQDYAQEGLTAGKKSQLLEEIFTSEQVIRKIKRIRIWPRLAAAAMIIVIFSAGLFFYNVNTKKKISNVIAYKDDVGPANQGATLILASGKKIKLSGAANGELAKEAGVVITKTTNGQLVYEIKGSNSNLNSVNTLSTAKGETYQLRLPDGSQIWLNAASSLTYSAGLIVEGKRRVMLDGEAYFEISKDKSHPFVVQTKKQEVEVLGTHFNVDSYGNEPTAKTTLIEGSVRINHKVILKPNQQAKTDQTGITVTNVRTETFTDWKDGIFNFENERLPSIMRKIARWYDVEVDYSGVEKSLKTYSGTISKQEHISKVLQLLEESEGIRFKLDKKKLIVYNN